jgi:hypothetical protein
LALAAACHRAKDDPGPDPENDQVGDHLRGDQEPRSFRLGGDITEPDCAEHGDGEVQRVGVGQLLAEVAGRDRGQDEVGGGENSSRNSGRLVARASTARRPGNRDPMIQRTWKITSAMNATSR